MRENFTPCLSLLWAWLGDAELDDPHKRGAVRLGVPVKTLASWRSTTLNRVNLNDLMKGEAAAILHIWYWRAAQCDELPEGLDYAIFATAVGNGPLAAKRALQTALGSAPTGALIGRDFDRISRHSTEALIRSIAPNDVVLRSALKMAEPNADTA